jgi:hypothetical protein
VLVQIDGTRRANSFNFYKKVTGTGAEPVKLLDTQSTQQTFENLPAGVTLEITVTGGNDAGEGPASEPRAWREPPQSSIGPPPNFPHTEAEHDPRSAGSL